jgi:hypothetical protein
MPLSESRFNSNLYHSFEVVGDHIIIFGFYTNNNEDSA